MASSILKGLVTNYGSTVKKWHQPFTKRKSAPARSLLYGTYDIDANKVISVGMTYNR